MSKWLVKSLRWLARHSSIKYQTLLTLLYVPVRVVGIKLTLIIILGVIKELKTHQQWRIKHAPKVPSKRKPAPIRQSGGGVLGDTQRQGGVSDPRLNQAS